ncbi:MAG TPA: hypothetical protein VM914_13940, partial [Pyrinomonadaceae bacterium]|nr:hypothetical protein [Pyrinomonadaceae bacterium]
MAQNAASDSKQGRGEAQGAVVTASSTASGVRFVSPGQSRRVRLEVYTQAGERLFDSDFRAGSIVDWGAQGIADGSYLCVVTAEDLRGASSRRLSAVNVAQGRATLRGDNEEKLRAEFAQALSAAGQSDADSLAARQKKAQALTVSAHDGTNGQVTSTTGSLTFRTGDVLSGNDREQMRVTPEGRVGIGTDAPQATLDVAGSVRAQDGIVFGDGTVLKSANDLKGNTIVGVAANSAGGFTTNAAGSGTAGKISKWVDGAGTLGDSSIAEVNGNISLSGAVPAGHASTIYKSLWLQNNVSLISEAASGYSVVSLASNLQRSSAVTWGFVDPTKPAWRFHLGSGPGFDQFSVTRSAPNVFNELTLFKIDATGNIGIGVGAAAPTHKLEVVGDVKMSGAGSGIVFADGTKQTTAAGAGGGSMTGAQIVTALNTDAVGGFIGDARITPNVARLAGQNNWTGQNTFNGLSMNGTNIVNVANPVSATDATNKAYVDANAVKFVPGAEQLSVGDANGTAPMINLRGGSTCCSGPGGHTPAFFKVFQNGSFVATGNLGIGTSPMEGKGYRTSWHTYKGAFRSGYADNEWDDA